MGRKPALTRPKIRFVSGFKKKKKKRKKEKKPNEINLAEQIETAAKSCGGVHAVVNSCTGKRKFNKNKKKRLKFSAG